MMTITEETARRVAGASYALLLLYVVLWEAWLAPPTPVSRAFWLTVKLLPLVVLLPGLWRGKPRAYVIASLVVLLYFCAGVAAAYDAAKRGTPYQLTAAFVEIVTSLIFIAAAPLCARLIWRRSSPTPAGTGS